MSLMKTVAVEHAQPYSLELDDGRKFICCATGHGKIRLPCRMVHTGKQGSVVGVVTTIGSNNGSSICLMFGDINLNNGTGLHESSIRSMSRRTWARPVRTGA